MRPALAALAVLAALAPAGCRSHASPHTLASPAQCKALRDKSRALLAASGNHIMLEQFDAVPMEQWMHRCLQRTTAGQARCQLAARSLAAMSACKPEFDWRGDQVPPADQCRRLSEHMEGIAARSGGQAGAPALARSVYLSECRRSLRTSEVTCMLAAATWPAVTACRQDPFILPKTPGAAPAPPARPADRPRDERR